MMAETREQAIDRMVEDAERMGANAIVGVRFSTQMIMRGASEILACGTAVSQLPVAGPQRRSAGSQAASPLLGYLLSLTSSILSALGGIVSARTFEPNYDAALQSAVH